jgi:hypothetical protein
MGGAYCWNLTSAGTSLSIWAGDSKTFTNNSDLNVTYLTVLGTVTVSDVSSVFATEWSSLFTACSWDSKPFSSKMDEDYCDLAQLLCISGSTRNFSLIRRIWTIYSGQPTYCQVGIGRKRTWTIISPVTSTGFRGWECLVTDCHFPTRPHGVVLWCQQTLIYVFLLIINATHFFMYLFIPCLYIFRASQCSSSGDRIVLIHYLVWLVCVSDCLVCRSWPAYEAVTYI